MPESQSKNHGPSETNTKLWHGPVVAGAIAAVVTPFEVTKKRIQTGLPFSARPTILYKGCLSFFGSLTPTTTTQMTLNNFFQRVRPASLNNWQQGAYTQATTVVAASAGGLFSTMVENIILSQHLHSVGPARGISYLIKAGGLPQLYCGLPNLLCREAIFGYMMLAGGERTGHYLSELTGRDMMGPGMLCAGIIGATASHPFDAWATQKQRLVHIAMGAAEESVISKQLGIIPNKELGQQVAECTLKDTFMNGLVKVKVPSNFELAKTLKLSQSFAGLIPRWGLFTGAMVTGIWAKEKLENLNRSRNSFFRADTPNREAKEDAPKDTITKLRNRQ
ncbi:MAG: hypothetical protein CMF50_01230 [Legionellales bacterium]|nr:hypothetical protein [Legionellales bacterium]|tara:strand:- start:6894 stop:7898 length:1005 start_codon:yes stop_codon:yes gene_type:complete